MVRPTKIYIVLQILLYLICGVLMVIGYYLLGKSIHEILNALKGQREDFYESYYQNESLIEE
jgi:hypothetical protein